MSYVYSVVVISNEFDKKKRQGLLDGLNAYMKEDNQLGVPFAFVDTGEWTAGKKGFPHDLLVGSVNFLQEEELMKAFEQIELDEPAIMIITDPNGASVTWDHLGYKKKYL